MDRDPLLIVVIIACLGVAAILAFGIGSFAKGGKFNQKNGNKMMQLRLAAQAVAVILILILIAAR
ncbi:twin transmembrane helix small protein [Shimia ponticola]|uniref:twin transmembrane helix small protein n=1 Tax=Shimia ponticola TaxID=2582893 RepID=UPI0011BEF730|nr:twin transmembrane helix small protein [Shimia ponticola]